MPLFATFVGSIFFAVAEFFALYMAKKLAVLVAAVSLITGLTAGLYAVFQGLLTGIIATTPDIFATIGYALLPSNLTACLTALVTARLAKFVYNANKQIILTYAGGT